MRSGALRKGAFYSACLHLAIFALAVYGLPRLFQPTPATEVPITVDLVTVAAETNAPPPAPARKPAVIARKAPPTPMPKVKKPAPKAVKAPPPPPPPPPLPKAKKLPLSEILKSVKKTTPEKPSIKKPVEPPREERFASVLKTIDALRRPPAPSPDPGRADIPERVTAKSFAPPSSHNPDKPLTISEIDPQRRQNGACWNLPVGAREMRNLIVELWLEINRDGTVRHARVVDTERMGSDPFFRSAAESALRAVRNPRCSPLRLPADKYDLWKTMVLKFDPKELLGQ
jgi:hypothetical protein